MLKLLPCGHLNMLLSCASFLHGMILVECHNCSVILLYQITIALCVHRNSDEEKAELIDRKHDFLGLLDFDFWQSFAFRLSVTSSCPLLLTVYTTTLLPHSLSILCLPHLLHGLK